MTPGRAVVQIKRCGDCWAAGIATASNEGCGRQLALEGGGPWSWPSWPEQFAARSSQLARHGDGAEGGGRARAGDWAMGNGGMGNEN
jgi:hypothetical protein